MESYSNANRRRLTVPQRHQLRIAKDTIKNPAKALLGGPSVREAHEIVARLTFTVQRARIICDSCNLARVNGVLCHEQGCGHERQTWDVETQSWVRMVKCFTCGFDAPEGTECCGGAE